MKLSIEGPWAPLNSDRARFVISGHCVGSMGAVLADARLKAWRTAVANGFTDPCGNR